MEPKPNPFGILICVAALHGAVSGGRHDHVGVAGNPTTTHPTVSPK